MLFTDKLRHLCVDRNKSAVSRRAGLPPNGIADYFGKGYLPRADTALRIVQALNVSLEWLVDDRQGWPPVWLNRLPSSSDSPAVTSSAAGEPAAA